MGKIHWGAIAAIAGVIGAIATVVGVVVAIVGPPKLTFGNGGTTTTTSQPPGGTAPESGDKPPVAEPPSDNPPPVSSPPVSAMADVEVTKACYECIGPRQQGQVILQLRITNRSSVPLNAAIANIRLLVPGDTPMEGWTPNEPTAQLSRVVLDNGSYWAIPANGNKAWEPEHGTFASHWYAGTLEPGQSHSASGIDTGEVVFYLPLNSDGQATVTGVALVTNDGASVLGWQPTESWPPSTSPKTF